MRARTRFVALAIATACVTTISSAGTTVAAQRGTQLALAQRSAIDRAAIEALATQGVPGLSVTIARDGEILYARGFGTISKNDHERVDAQTIFPIGSITKQFTAAAIALLAVDRKLSFDAPLATYLPDAPHAREITIRQLLQHTSGLANYTAQPGFLASVATSTTISPSDLLALVANEPLGFTPGTHFEYSNTNYVALGAVIEAVTKQTYAAVIRDRIARPLGLTTLSFGPPAGARDVVRSPWTAQATYAAGGLYASPADLARFDREFFAGRLVPPKIVELMTTPPPIPNAALHYGFAWVSDTLDGREQRWHNGGVLGASTRNCWFPRDGVAVVVFGNELGFDPAPIVRAAMRVVVPPSAATLEAEQTAASGEDAAITSEARAQFVGWSSGAIDLKRYDAAMRAAIDVATIASVGHALSTSGTPSAFIYKGREQRGTVVVYRYRVETPRTTFIETIAFDPDGQIAGLRFLPAP